MLVQIEHRVGPSTLLFKHFFKLLTKNESIGKAFFGKNTFVPSRMHRGVVLQRDCLGRQRRRRRRHHRRAHCLQKVHRKILTCFPRTLKQSNSQAARRSNTPRGEQLNS